VFSSIVVPLDLEVLGDRPLPVARRLDRFARDTPNSVLVTVTSRWADRKPHRHRTARAVAQRSSCRLSRAGAQGVGGGAGAVTAGGH
jgi:hypothetical protein